MSQLILHALILSLSLFVCTARVQAAQISDSNIIVAVGSATPAGWTATWGEPTHLFEDFPFTPALEASLVRLSPDGTSTDAGILIIKTAVSDANPTGLYPHDYRVCASLHGSTLLSVLPIPASSATFDLLDMSKPSVHEHAVGFIVRDFASSYEIDSKRLAELYPPASTEDVFTFQVWSESQALTTQILTDLISALSSLRPTTFSNPGPGMVPPVSVRRVRFIEDEIVVRLSLVASATVRVDVVAFAYPNPTPTVSTISDTLDAGDQTLRVPISTILSGATDAELYVFQSGTLHDKVLASFNAYGDATSSWFPFSGGAAFAEILLPNSDPNSNGSPNDILLNHHTVRLNANADEPGDFVGMFTELLPESEEPGDLRQFESVAFVARSPASLGPREFSFKLELANGDQYEAPFSPGDTWQEVELPFASFQRFGVTADWSMIGDEVRRMSIVASYDPSVPSTVSLEISDLSARRAPIPVPESGPFASLLSGAALLLVLRRRRLPTAL